MTEVNPPAYEQGGCYTAQTDRQVLASLVCEEGVVTASDLVVTDSSSGNLSVTVGEGYAFVQGDPSPDQGMYMVWNNGPVDVTLATADPTLARRDLIIARVYDAEYGGTLNEWHLEVVTGEPGVPSDPAVPDSALVLARVTVPGGGTDVQPSWIEDLRETYTLCQSSSLRTGVTYNASGTFTKANYPWLKQIKVRVIGAGGAGGGTQGTGAGEAAAGGGGGGGGYAERIIDADTLTANCVVTVGTGGAGASGGNGANGTASSFNTGTGLVVTATGGAGGIVGNNTATTATSQGGSGGTGSNGLVNSQGEPGEYGQVDGGNRLLTGRGGSSGLGYGQGGRPGNNAVGGAGQIHGGGGGGATSFAGEPARAGGAGANGVVIIELFG